MSTLRFERRFRRRLEARGGRWEELRYPRPEAGGATRAVRLTPPGPPHALALVAHGAGNDALYSFVGLFETLLERGVEVFAFDMDGHGRSCDTRLLAAGARNAVAAALEQSGAAQRGLPVHALGVSLGGSILLAALPDLHPRFASATLLVAPIRIELSPAAIRAELSPAILRTLWRERGRYGLLGLVPSFGPFKREVYPLRLGNPPPSGPFGYVAVLNDLLEELRPEAAAPRAELPVLLVYGERDRIVPAEQGERLARLLPRAELLVLPGATHLTAPLEPGAVERIAHWIAG